MSLRIKITLALVTTITVALLTMTAARADQLGNLLRLVEYQLKALATRPELIEGSVDRDLAALEALQGLLPPEVKNLIWAEPSGRYANSTGARGNLADRPYFQQVAQGADLVISDAVVSKSLGIPIIVVAVPASIQVGPESYGWLIDEKGLILAA